MLLLRNPQRGNGYGSAFPLLGMLHHRWQLRCREAKKRLPRLEIHKPLKKKKDNGKPTKSDLLKECLKYWSLIIRNRDGFQCWIDGCEKESVQAHHIFPKRHYRAVMFDLDNGACLCRGHHAFFAESDHERFRDFVIERIGKKRWESLKARANRDESYTIDDLMDIREKLKRMVDK